MVRYDMAWQGMSWKEKERKGKTSEFKEMKVKA
jgi:hypothetical protein